MRRILFVLALLPAVALAADGPTERDIMIPATLVKDGVVSVTLDESARNAAVKGVLVVSSANRAVAYEDSSLAVDLTHDAVIVKAPAAANTIPRTSIDALWDGTNTAFQPVTARSHVFLLKFPRQVAPTSLKIGVEEGVIESLTVRIGDSEGLLRSVVTGVTPAYGNGWVELTGEKTQYMELRMTVQSGTFRLGELSIEEVQPRMFFRAVKNETYRLVFGLGLRGIYPRDTTLQTANLSLAVPVTLGPSRAAAVPGDLDGVEGGVDNCAGAWNPDQHDQDQDAVGDACDNCLLMPNNDQADADGDGRGDLCDDDDSDGIQNSVDNCPTVKNPMQEDEDRDGKGNLCDGADSRFSAKGWVLWLSLGAVIALLLFMAARVLQKQPS